ncbi:hypothetical protein [Flavobacterium sp. C3NV]|uniref:hypothetical protein n=1 Tax=Flavobacterium sp. C3NV TaxID=3393358 RepID=UPI0039901940
MKKYYFIFLILFGCNDSRKINAYRDFSNEISAEVNSQFLINDKQINESDIMHIRYPYSIEAEGFCGVFIGKSYSKDEYDKKVLKIQKEYKEIIPSRDNCIKYIPNENINSCNLCNEKILPNVNDSLIIPKNYLSKNIFFFIKNEMKGIYLKEKYDKYFKSNQNIYHGYSIGVVIDNDKKTIIDWLIIK